MTARNIDPALDLTEWDSQYQASQQPKAGDLMIMQLPDGLRVPPPGWTLMGDNCAWRISNGFERYFPFPVIFPPASVEFMLAP